MDPKKLLEAGGEAIEAIGLIKKVVALRPAGKPQQTRRKRDWNPQFDKDRRNPDNVELRLKTGIWLHFHFRTGHGKFEVLESTDAEKLILAFLDESVNYQFFDKASPGTLVMPSTIKTSAADHACAKWLECPHKKRYASVLSEEFGNYIFSRCEVRMIERRRVSQHRSAISSISALLKRARVLFGEDHPEHRAAKDRRKLTVESRFKRGLWLQFHRITGFGISEVLDRPQQISLMNALNAEWDHYVISDRSSGAALTSSMIAALVVDMAHTEWKRLPEKKRRALVLTDRVANFILFNYNVRMSDRRKDTRHHVMAG